MTPEQQKALAIAKARRRRAEATPAQPTQARGQRGGARGTATPRDAMSLFTDMMFGGATRQNEPAFDIDPYQTERGLETAFIPGIEIAGLMGGIGRAAARNVPRIGGKQLAKIQQKQTFNDALRGYVGYYGSKKNKMEQVKRTDVVGKTKKFVRNLDEKQARAMAALAETPGIRPGLLNQEVYNLANKEYQRIGEKLGKMFEMRNVPIKQDEIESAINRSIRVLKNKSPGLRRNKTRIEDLKDDALFIIQRESRTKDGTTLADLYKARKALDAEYNSYKTIKLQNPSANTTADEQVWLSLRSAMNALVDAKSPGNAADMRKKQYGLKTAMDDILQDKARIEKETMLQRGLERVQDVKDKILDTRATIKPGR